jgi:hypothetical protein
MGPPVLRLVAVTTCAVTYSFFTTGSGFRSWALCTVNDATGELLITSDWGSWSHRWNTNPSALGAETLTEFIGRGSIDYLACKLQREDRAGQRWSADATVKTLRRLLCGRRLADGRDRRKACQPLQLKRWHARDIWDQIGALVDGVGDSAALFYERACMIDGFSEFVTREPWEYGETEQTPEDRALRDSVLPALIAACRDRHAKAERTSCG